MSENEREAGERCRQCARPIPDGAKLCSHCNSYQDWRGFLTVSNTVLALLVALISVASIALPALVNVVRPQRSQVTVSNPVFEKESVLLVATNVGERPGIVRRAELESSLLGGQADLELSSAADAFVPAGAHQVAFAIEIRRNALESLMQFLKVASVTIGEREDRVGTLTVWTEQSNGLTTGQRFAVRRIDLMNLFEAHRLRCEANRAPPSTDNGCTSLDDLIRETNVHADRTIARLRGAPQSR